MRREVARYLTGCPVADDAVLALSECVWYPGEPVVPSTGIDQAWHAHILDTRKYARDCQGRSEITGGYRSVTLRSQTIGA